MNLPQLLYPLVRWTQKDWLPVFNFEWPVIDALRAKHNDLLQRFEDAEGDPEAQRDVAAEICEHAELIESEMKSRRREGEALEARHPATHSMQKLSRWYRMEAPGHKVEEQVARARGRIARAADLARQAEPIR